VTLDPVSPGGEPNSAATPYTNTLPTPFQQRTDERRCEATPAEVSSGGGIRVHLDAANGVEAHPPGDGSAATDGAALSGCGPVLSRKTKLSPGAGREI
jgi:hypothetical protein